MEKQSFKNWWTYTVKGVFAIAFGLIALFIPNASNDWLVQLFGGFIILSGIFLIGGAMAYTFLKSRAVPIGNSLFEDEELVNAFQIIDRADLEHCKILLPIDHVVADTVSPDAKAKTVGKMDIGPMKQL